MPAAPRACTSKTHIANDKVPDRHLRRRPPSSPSQQADCSSNAACCQRNLESNAFQQEMPKLCRAATSAQKDAARGYAARLGARQGDQQGRSNVSVASEHCSVEHHTSAPRHSRAIACCLPLYIHGEGWQCLSHSPRPHSRLRPGWHPGAACFPPFSAGSAAYA